MESKKSTMDIYEDEINALKRQLHDETVNREIAEEELQKVSSNLGEARNDAKKYRDRFALIISVIKPPFEVLRRMGLIK